MKDDGTVTGFAVRGASAARASYHFIGAQMVHAEASGSSLPGQPAQTRSAASTTLSSRLVPVRFADMFPTRRSGISGRPDDYARTSAEFEKLAKVEEVRPLFMMDQRTPDGSRVRRPHRPVSRREPDLRRPRSAWCRLTGDASDRRVPPHHFAGRTVDRCWHCTRTRSTSRALPFANVARLLQQMPLPVPAILGHPMPSASSRCRIWAT